MSHNPVTGDSIRTKPGDQDKFEEGYERIWGKLNHPAKDQKATLICPRCKVDRLKEPCPGPLHMCAMTAIAQTSTGDK